MILIAHGILQAKQLFQLSGVIFELYNLNWIRIVNNIYCQQVRWMDYLDHLSWPMNNDCPTLVWVWCDPHWWALYVRPQITLTCDMAVAQYLWNGILQKLTDSCISFCIILSYKSFYWEIKTSKYIAIGPHENWLNNHIQHSMAFLCCYLNDFLVIVWEYRVCCTHVILLSISEKPFGWQMISSHEKHRKMRMFPVSVPVITCDCELIHD